MIKYVIYWISGGFYVFYIFLQFITLFRSPFSQYLTFRHICLDFITSSYHRVGEGRCYLSGALEKVLFGRRVTEAAI